MKKGMIFIIGLLLLTSCNQHNTELEESIDSVITNQNEDKILINSYTNFEWDKAYLFTPYTSESNINEQLKIRFKDKSNLNERDDIYLLIFLNEDKVVQYTEIKRNGSDFSIDDKNYLTPQKDIISIKRHKKS